MAKAAVILFVLVGAASAVGAQTKGVTPHSSPPPKTYLVPTPAPMPPPTNPGPVVVPRDGLSPLLTQPGPLAPPARPVGPSYPPSPVPAPIDQQKMQSYRNDLINQRFELDRRGVSPGNERYREIQQQLNQPSSR